MSSGVLALLSAALLLSAAGLLGWLWAVRRQQGLAVGQHLDRRFTGEAIERREPRWSEASTAAKPVAPSARSAAGRSGSKVPFVLPPWFLGAASWRGIGIAAVLELAAMLAIWSVLGALAAAVALMLAACGSVFVLWFLIQRKREQLISQLPGFLDSMVRLISIGNSTHAAFQTSVPATKNPLRGYLDHVSGLVRAGMDLEPALLQVARSVRVEELHLLASILGLSVRYGGRADVLLERMANFMRDREQAQHELVALSAETRLSAWVLGLLPVLVGGAIVMMNADYFMHLWADATGRLMLYWALALQAAGAFWLYRLARSI